MKTAATSVATSPTRLRTVAINASNTIKNNFTKTSDAIKNKAISVATSPARMRVALANSIISSANSVKSNATNVIDRWDARRPNSSNQTPVAIPVETKYTSPKVQVLKTEPIIQAQSQPASNNRSTNSRQINSNNIKQFCVDNIDEKLEILKQALGEICENDKYNFVYNILNLDNPIQKCIKNYTAYSIEESHNQIIDEIYNLKNIDSFKNRISLLEKINKLTKHEGDLDAYKDLINLLISNIEQKNEGLDNNCKPFNQNYLNDISGKATAIYNNIQDCNTDFFLNEIKKIIKEIGQSYSYE
jgi:hypothetical protein